MSEDNVAGVRLPVFTESHQVPSEKKGSYGLSGGGQAIANSKVKWKTLLSALIKLASLQVCYRYLTILQSRAIDGIIFLSLYSYYQTSFVALDDAIKVTNRRVNALESVVIPSIVDVIKYIESELDELEREDIFRLKKVRKELLSQFRIGFNFQF